MDIKEKAGNLLYRLWALICSRAEKNALGAFIKDEPLIAAIRESINSETKSYRYALPTQIIAKLVNPELDCRCIQSSRGGKGAFDARTIAHSVIVPFDQANEKVLGGSIEPYVNNPLRVPEISEKYRSAQKNKKDWDNLIAVLNVVEKKNDPKITETIFMQILLEIYRRLSEIKVSYPFPRRISLNKSLELIENFISERSGGDRLLAVTAALFVLIGKRFNLYSEVRRGNITSSDSSAGMVADLECLSNSGEIVVAVEVKDRELSISHLRDKIPNMREKQVSELFFVTQMGMVKKDESDIEKVIKSEFVSGHNIYITDLISLSRAVLALTGEIGRREFIKEIADQLEKYRSDVSHRRNWADLLKSV